jgi:hypothetical protein
MLVVDGECLQRFARRIPWAEWDIQQLAPACRRVVVPPGTPRCTCEGAERVYSNRCRLRLLHQAGHRHRALECLDRAILQSAALIHASERQRLVRVACLSGTIAQELQQTRRQAGQRQQVESVVLENCAKRTCIAGSEKLKVARGNLEPRYIADAVRAKDLLFERNERA